jgi:predicted DCC family thiol-disulfide oxidoreductase YuxK
MGLLVFDGDCGFCTSSVAFARRWISRDTDAVPWQRTDLDSLGLTENACQQAVQYRDNRGLWFSAGAAVIALLRDARPPWSWLGRVLAVTAVAPAVERLYAFVANNRSRLPGGTPACQLPEPRE